MNAVPMPSVRRAPRYEENTAHLDASLSPEGNVVLRLLTWEGEHEFELSALLLARLGFTPDARAPATGHRTPRLPEPA